jgi:O-antigen ligase
MRPAARDWTLRAACLYAALIPFQPVVDLPDGSVLRIAGAELVAPFILVAALLRPRRRLAPGLALLAAAVALVALFSTLLAATERPLTGYAVGKLVGLFYVTGVGFALARGLGEGAEPQLLRALAEGGFWSAVIGLAGFAASLAGHATALVEGGRLCSTMPGDPNIYGSLLAVALLIVAMDARRTPVGRVVRLTVLASALVLTASRSAFVALVAGVAAGMMLRSRDRWLTAARGLYGLVAAGLVAVLFLLTDPGQDVAQLFWDRVSRTFTIESRFDLYDRALEQFGEHPVLGLGIGGFHDLNEWGTARDEHYAVHNTYLWALVDMGTAGGLLLAALVVGAIGRCARVKQGPAAEAAAVGAALAAMAVFNLFVDGYYQRHLWILIACALGTPLVGARRLAIGLPWRVRGEPSVGWAEVR